MKKFITLLLVLTGMVLTASADDVTVYLFPKQNGGIDLTEASAKLNLYYYKSSDASDNGSCAFTKTYDYGDGYGVYTATMPEGFDKIEIFRGSSYVTSEGDAWNYTGVLDFNSATPFYAAKSYDSKIIKVASGAVHKVLIQNKSNSTIPKIYTWGATNINAPWPGFTLNKTESLDGATWNVFLTCDASFKSKFTLTGDTDATTQIDFNLTTEPTYFFYFPADDGDRYLQYARKIVSGTNVYATFSWTDGNSNNKGANFGDLPSGVKAYTLTTAGNAIEKTAFTSTLNKAKGVLLENTTGSDAVLYIRIWNNGNEDTSENQLYAIDATTASSVLPQHEGGNTNFILTLVDEHVGFYKVNASGSWVNEGTAYLQVSGSLARDFFPLDEESTSIESVQAIQILRGEYFNLVGQRVAQPTKGLYIVNGKKLIIK